MSPLSLCLFPFQGSRDPDQVGSQQSSRLVEPGGPDVWYDDWICKWELLETKVISVGQLTFEMFIAEQT